MERQRLSWEILDAFRDAAAQNGIPCVDDFNGGDNAGCAYFEVNQRRGIRLNTAKAFLRPAACDPNLTIMTGCHVERLLLEETEQGPACRGVRFSGGGRLFSAQAMSMAPSQLGSFARPDTAQATPNLQYHVQPLSLDKFGDPLHGFPAFTVSVCNLWPTSRGHVRIAAGDSAAPPKITPNYLGTPEDRKVAADALALTRRIVAAPALAKYRPEEFKPGPHYRTEEELAEAAGLIGTTIFHPVGTCRMGAADDPLAVVDSCLHVKGVAGLRVVDASVMPWITSGNTNAPTLMIAEKAAQLIHDTH